MMAHQLRGMVKAKHLTTQEAENRNTKEKKVAEAEEAREEALTKVEMTINKRVANPTPEEVQAELLEAVADKGPRTIKELVLTQRNSTLKNTTQRRNNSTGLLKSKDLNNIKERTKSRVVLLTRALTKTTTTLRMQELLIRDKATAERAVQRDNMELAVLAASSQTNHVLSISKEEAALPRRASLLREDLKRVLNSKRSRKSPLMQRSACLLLQLVLLRPNRKVKKTQRRAKISSRTLSEERVKRSIC
jgi:hypothetical protein